MPEVSATIVLCWKIVELKLLLSNLKICQCLGWLRQILAPYWWNLSSFSHFYVGNWLILATMLNWVSSKSYLVVDVNLMTTLLQRWNPSTGSWGIVQTDTSENLKKAKVLKWTDFLWHKRSHWGERKWSAGTVDTSSLSLLPSVSSTS